jgi:hypothetical protein
MQQVSDLVNEIQNLRGSFWLFTQKTWFLISVMSALRNNMDAISFSSKSYQELSAKLQESIHYLKLSRHTAIQANELENLKTFFDDYYGVGNKVGLPKFWSKEDPIYVPICKKGVTA